MKYQVVLDDTFILYDLREKELILDEPELELTVSKVGKFTFSIYPDHPYFDRIEKKSSKVEVFKNGTSIFRGRVIEDEQGLYNNKDVLCESALAYLNDSIVRPSIFKGSPLEFLRMIINNHNSQVNDKQKLKLGIVTVTDSNNYISRSWEDYSTSWELLEKRGLELVGGYLVERYEEDGTYLDWVDDFDKTSSQDIEFGENLIDILAKNDASSTYSVVIPLGAEIENSDGTKKRLTIESVNDNKDYLVNEEALAKYGWIVVPISETTWDDVTVASNLKNKGTDFLNNQAIMMTTSLDITALDLQATDKTIDSFFIYMYVNVKSKIHNISKSFLLKSIKIPLSHPENTQITLGETTNTLTGIELGNKKNVDEVINRVGIVEKNYEINNEKITEIDNSVDELIKVTETHTTKIEQNEKNIALEASRIDDLTNYIKDVEAINSLVLTKTANSSGAINKLVISGFTQMPLYPSMAYPSDNTYPGVLTTYCIVQTGISETNETYIVLDKPLTGTDELIIEENKVYVKNNGTISFKNQLATLKTFEGNTTITVKYFDNLTFNCRYMIKNSFTSTFATKSESNAQFQIISDEISSKVSKDGIISEINQSAEKISIKSQKISLEGIVTANKNFKVLEDGSIEAKNGSFSGNIYLQDGNRVVGGDGILTNLQYSTPGVYGGYDILGFEHDDIGTGEFLSRAKDISLDVYIPENFTIAEAKVMLFHTPADWYIYNQYNDNYDEVLGYCRNVKLFKSSGDENYQFIMGYYSEYKLELDTSSLEELTNSLGTNGYTATNTSGSSIQSITSTDIKNYLESGNNKIVLRSALANPTSERDMLSKSGMARAVINIIGYMSM